MNPYQRIQFIINPAAGGDEPILSIINDVLKPYDVDWQVSITHKAGDGARFAQEALATGVDLVVAYGGDGTLLDVASGMLNAPVPLGFVAGGTANALVQDLDIPRPPADAVRLLMEPHTVRAIDVGEVAGRYFLLRAGTGLVEDFSVGVNREMKDRYGLFAYFIGAAKALVSTQASRYKVTIDGRAHDLEGVMCLVTNGSATGGQTPVRIAEDILIDDGLLDVIVARGDFTSYLDIVLTAAQVDRATFQSESIFHAQGKRIQIETDTPMAIYADGEEEAIAHTPCTFNVLPGALRVIVPPPQATN
ncbi:diacylglycerol kinase family protein [Aggregatilineales bacterium SYSU G02658]